MTSVPKPHSEEALQLARALIIEIPEEDLAKSGLLLLSQEVIRLHEQNEILSNEKKRFQEQLDTLKQERDRLALAAVHAQDHLRPSHAAHRVLAVALFPARNPDA